MRLMFLIRSMLFWPWSSRRPMNGETYTGVCVALVAAYTAAACSWEKHRVILTLILCRTDISAAWRPPGVHLIYAFGIQAYISMPWVSISSPVVFMSANTSIETPAVPTRGEMLCTIFLYSSFCSVTVSLWPAAIRSLRTGFLATKDGFVVYPSMQPRRALISLVSAGSPPSSRILVPDSLIAMTCLRSNLVNEGPSCLARTASFRCQTAGHRPEFPASRGERPQHLRRVGKPFPVPLVFDARRTAASPKPEKRIPNRTQAAHAAI